MYRLVVIRNPCIFSYQEELKIQSLNPSHVVYIDKDEVLLTTEFIPHEFTDFYQSYWGYSGGRPYKYYLRSTCIGRGLELTDLVDPERAVTSEKNMSERCFDRTRRGVIPYEGHEFDESYVDIKRYHSKGSHVSSSMSQTNVSDTSKLHQSPMNFQTYSSPLQVTPRIKTSDDVYRIVTTFVFTTMF